MRYIFLACRSTREGWRPMAFPWTTSASVLWESTSHPRRISSTPDRSENTPLSAVLNPLGVNLASSPHIINSRQVRKYSPLRSPQSLGSINSYILHIHDLQTGQKILSSLQYSIPWEYKLKYSSYS